MMQAKAVVEKQKSGWQSCQIIWRNLLFVREVFALVNTRAVVTCSHRPKFTIVVARLSGMTARNLDLISVQIARDFHRPRRDATGLVGLSLACHQSASCALLRS